MNVHRFLHYTALAAACLVACAAGAAGEKPKMTAIVRSGFEQGLAGWTPQGKAEFAADRAEHHTGTQAARITIPADAERKYQQLQRHVDGVRPGDAFRATLWVRTRGVAQDPGAYAVLEYLGDGNRRVGIDHSPTGAANGRDAWQKLTIAGTAPQGTRRLRVALVLHAHGSAWFDDVEVVRTARIEPWPDLGEKRRTIAVHADRVVLARFGGVGFHVFHHVFPTTPEHHNEVLAKRWRELNPSFARLNDKWDWDRETLDRVADHLLRLKATGTEVYFATWGPKDTPPGPERAAYARRVVDNLEYFVRTKGATNVRTYCMSNELSLGGWGTLRRDLPKFRDYHRHLHDELGRRKLPIRLLATDASPVGSWNTLQWAAEHMDDITGVYGGHHYFNRYAPDDEQFYPWFLERLTWGARLARSKGKDFILGEFGCKQDGRTRNGIRMDACIYWGTPLEPLVGIQLAEAAIAAINAGVYALGNWTFNDFPDGYSTHYANKWGTSKWSGSDTSTRPHYYAYGLLTKFFRGPAAVWAVETSDPRLRAAALQHHGGKTLSIAVVNRNPRKIDVDLAIEGGPSEATFRKYVYDPASPPFHPFGDLQPPEKSLAMARGRLADSLRPGSLTVYTTACDDKAPAPVERLRVEPAPGGARRLAWNPSPEPDLCYYRIYRAAEPDTPPSRKTRIGSTVATSFTDPKPTPPAHYTVVAVDQSANPVEP